jgi:hypothetical protein
MTWDNRSKVAIVGVDISAIERRTAVPLGSLALDAAHKAIADSGLTARDIDGIATYPSAPFAGARNRDGEDVVTSNFFLSPILLDRVRWYAQAGAGMIAASIRDAANALISGACNYVLVWRAMYVPAGKYNELPSMTVGGEAQFSAPYGCSSPPQWHTIVYRRYL